DCRNLVAAMAKLGGQWVKYQNGLQTDDFRPLPDFWEAFRQMQTARQGSVARVKQTRESVELLRRDKQPDLQIAKMYGKYNFDLKKWEGVFFTDRGVPNSALIDQEEKQPGSVLTADYVHPDDAEAMARSESDLERELQALESATQGPDTDPATIEEMLREGAFPAQIARAKGVTVSDVLKVANELGITPNEKPNLSNLRAPQEPTITAEQDAALQPRTTEAAEVQVAAEEGDDAELVARVMQLHGKGQTPLQIAQELGISPQKVGSIKRFHLHREAQPA
ncbi:MAG TPA: hypothetical protein VL475_02400, partial [Planctomycetaceae bacterium]|nr:hypothetical protein [Planctomycetaceae bacterium]